MKWFHSTTKRRTTHVFIDHTATLHLAVATDPARPPDPPNATDLTKRSSSHFTIVNFIDSTVQVFELIILGQALI